MNPHETSNHNEWTVTYSYLSGKFEDSYLSGKFEDASCSQLERLCKIIPLLDDYFLERVERWANGSHFAGFSNEEMIRGYEEVASARQDKARRNIGKRRAA